MTDKEINKFMDLHKELDEILGGDISIFIVSGAFNLLLENLLQAAVKEMPSGDAFWLWVKAYNGLKNYKEINEGMYEVYKNRDDFYSLMEKEKKEKINLQGL